MLLCERRLTMRSDREANINKALDEGRYKDALSILKCKHCKGR